MCKYCDLRGKTWNGSDPKCGFPLGDTFTPENWNCATLNLLRGLSHKNGVKTYGEDNGSISVLALPISWNFDERGYLVMNWYKDRGCTDKAKIINEDEEFELTEELANAIIEHYTK
jgi:hypothetical protein